MARSQRSFRPTTLTVERLEDRLVPTTNVFLQGTELIIDHRTNGIFNDTSEVRVSGSNLIVDWNGGSKAFGSSGITGVTFYGGAGNDTFHNYTSLVGSLYGEAGNDSLYGGSGIDYLDGGSDNDYAHGGAGNDTVKGNTGDDVLDGYAGNDIVEGWYGADLLYGSFGEDVLYGEYDDDTLFGEDGYDLLDCGHGRDIAHGGTGNDTIKGGIGNDVLDGYAGDDLVEGWYGDDLLYGSFGNDTLHGEWGNDTLYGENGSDRLYAGDDNDYADGGTENDTISGGLGNDTLEGNAGHDLVQGETGDDLVYGASGDDTLYGGSGNDTLYGESGFDYIGGSNDQDLVDGGSENDTIYGGLGDDTLEGNSGNDTLYGSYGNDLLYGSSGHDSLNGEYDNDTLSGDSGDDSLRGGSGNDAYVFDADLSLGTDRIDERPGNGTDTVDFSETTDRFVTVNLGKATAQVVNGNLTLHFNYSPNPLIPVLSEIENAIGGAASDWLTGNTLNNILSGGDGGDSLYGGNGNDWLYGGVGSDYLSGGTGADLLDGGADANTYNAGATDGRRVLYVNFDGATITNQDLVNWANGQWQAAPLDANMDGIMVQAFLNGRPDREQVIQDVMRLLHEDFRAFDVDIQRHVGLAVAGRRATTLFIGPAVIDGAGAGLRGQASSVDFGNDNATDVGFVVRNWAGTNAEIAQFAANTAAHEAGHTFGLAHVNNNGLNELMRDGSFASDSQNARNNYAFLDQSFNLTGGTGTQNSYRVLLTNLSSATSAAGPTGMPVVGSDASAQDSGDSSGCGCELCRAAAQASSPGAATPASGEQQVRRLAEVQTSGAILVDLSFRGLDVAGSRGNVRVQVPEQAPVSAGMFTRLADRTAPETKNLDNGDEATDGWLMQELAPRRPKATVPWLDQAWGFDRE